MHSLWCCHLPKIELLSAPFRLLLAANAMENEYVLIPLMRIDRGFCCCWPFQPPPSDIQAVARGLVLGALLTSLSCLALCLLLR